MTLPPGSRFVPRTEWAPEQLDADRREAEERFRIQRMEEPLEEYLDHFEQAQDTLENLIESTVDLSKLEDHALAILSDPMLLEAFRYLTGPPISLDDLKVLADAKSLTPQWLQRNPELVRRLLQTIRVGLDRRRFPWVTEEREPLPAERDAAVLASAALIAMRRTETSRRTAGKKAQEAQVQQALAAHGFTEVSIPGGLIGTLGDAPQPGQFCREVIFGERKADIVVGLWDRRTMPIECKVSNSSTNSVKRLNNDAAIKAEVWIKDFGSLQVVPAATLSGVYKLRNLLQAQHRGLALYWAHRLSDLTEWIDGTRASP